MKRTDHRTPRHKDGHRWEVCVLAGGSSTRMRRDKTRLRLRRRTLLGHVRATARLLGVPVRTIRRDRVPRCGPVGGIYTALRTTRADSVLFLAGDMPFLSVQLLQHVRRRLLVRASAVFVCNQGVAGFPFALRRAALPAVERQLIRRQFSLQKLAAVLGALRLRVDPARAAELFNINTPEDWEAARRRGRSGGLAARPARAAD